MTAYTGTNVATTAFSLSLRARVQRPATPSRVVRSC
jgi:hypothetical protein